MSERRNKSFREYIDRLREIGELQEINEEVDWNLEIGAVIRRSYDLRAPAPLFNRIKGIEKGFRVLGAPAGTSRQPGLFLCRLALSLGLPPTATGRQIVDALVEARDKPTVKPKTISSGPCQEKVMLGDAVDLLRFPAPICHAGDGGRYIGTYGTVVARTPDGAWTNWAIARVMIVDKNKMTGIVSPFQHLGMIHKMWKDIGKPMPFALCLGVDPAISVVSAMSLPKFVDEADYVGGFLGEPIELVKCKSIDLEVPAHSEIVIEGTLSNNETALEGPMGEYAGYQPGGKGDYKPVYHVTAITHRENPILPMVVAGEPIEEDHTVQGIPSAAETTHLLRKEGLPVTLAWCMLEAANHILVVTVPSDWRSKIKKRLTDEQLIHEIGRIFFDSKFGAVVPKIIVLNDDVDASNTEEVIWAWATRCHPGRGEIHFKKEVSSPLVAFLKSSEKASFHTTKVIYNCLPPADWEHRLPQRTGFKYIYPKEIQERVLSRWKSSYGYQVE